MHGKPHIFTTFSPSPPILTCPPHCCHIINFDVAVRPNNVYLDVFSQYHLGKITYAWSDVDVHGDRFWAEAKVGLFAIISVFSHGFRHVIFEGDSLMLYTPS